LWRSLIQPEQLLAGKWWLVAIIFVADAISGHPCSRVIEFPAESRKGQP
jgi:hypothetical protein